MNLSSLYGRFAFLAHLLEDMVRLHVFEQGRIGDGRIKKRTIVAMERLSFKNAIDELDTLKYEQNFIQNLHRLRKVRNSIIHSLLADVGQDFANPSGTEQVEGLIHDAAEKTLSLLQQMRRIHGEFLHESTRTNLEKILSDDADWNAGTVSASEARALLKEMNIS